MKFVYHFVVAAAKLSSVAWQWPIEGDLLNRAQAVVWLF